MHRGRGLGDFRNWTNEAVAIEIKGVGSGGTWAGDGGCFRIGQARTARVTTSRAAAVSPRDLASSELRKLDRRYDELRLTH